MTIYQQLYREGSFEQRGNAQQQRRDRPTSGERQIRSATANERYVGLVPTDARRI
jgi:hypothetical protein